MTQHDPLPAPKVRAHRPSQMLATGLAAALLVFGVGNAAGQARPSAPLASQADAALASDTSKATRMQLTVGNRRFTLTVADTDAARAFVSQLPLTLDMPDLHSNEKHAKLPKALPANAIRPGTISNGDLMLYGSDTLVLFYLGFESAYSYTRLGRVDDPSGLAQALGQGTARITFSRW